MYSKRVFLLCYFFSSFYIIQIESHENSNDRFSSECYYQKSDFGVLTSTTISALKFFEKYMSELILDAAVGTRILEEQLILILNSNNLIRLPTRLYNYLEQILQKSKIISGDIINNVQNNPTISEQEKQNTMPWITTPLLLQSPKLYEWKSLQMNLTMNKMGIDFNKIEILNETISDTCIGYLFKNCQLPDECLKVFLTNPLSQYSLTHQVIYMLIAKQRRCTTSPIIQRRIGKDDGESFQNKLCSQVWIESNYISRQNFPLGLRDLFTEQVVVCSLAGYDEFLRRDWLQIILTWYSPSSRCFLHFEDTHTKVENEHSSSSNEYYGTTTTGNTRVKRSDVLIEISDHEVCSGHFTAIGIAALGMHIRKLLEECLIQ